MIKIKNRLMDLGLTDEQSEEAIRRKQLHILIEGDKSYREFRLPPRLILEEI